MPITKSAEKAWRQSKLRRTRNLKRKEAYKNVLKKIRKLIVNKKIEEAKKLVPQAYKALDKAAKTNVIRKGAAARKKSQAMHWLKKASA